MSRRMGSDKALNVPCKDKFLAPPLLSKNYLKNFLNSWYLYYKSDLKNVKINQYIYYLPITPTQPHFLKDYRAGLGHIFFT